MKALVTGGAGFIGGHLVDFLMDKNWEVVVVDNLESSDLTNLQVYDSNPKFAFYQRDICEDMEDIYEKHKPEVVFHLAALPRVQFSIDYPTETHRTNVNGTYNLLNISRIHKVKRFVFSSSSSVYGDQTIMPLIETMTPNPISPYALHKFIGEEYCRLFYQVYGLQTVSLRYFNVYGPRQNPNGNYANLIPKSIQVVMENKAPKYTNDGNQTRDFTYVSDVVRANYLAAITDEIACLGEAFNVGRGKNISVLEVLQEIVNLGGNRVRPEFWEKRLEPKDTLADVLKAKRLLKWDPLIDFKEGIKFQWNYASKI